MCPRLFKWMMLRMSGPMLQTTQHTRGEAVTAVWQNLCKLCRPLPPPEMGPDYRFGGNLLTYKSYYNIAPTYLRELISRRESSVNTRLGADHHQLIMPLISKDCSNNFLERSFIYAAPYEWNKLSACIRTSNLDSFRKTVKTMLFTQQYGLWVKIIDILLLFRMLIIVSVCYCYIVHWTRISMYIGHWTLNKY